jgi:hypothetical protein
MLCDFDNVITFTDYVVCNILFENRDKFGRYLKFLDRPYTLEEIYSREQYYLNDWLKRDDIDEVPKSIIDDISSIYCNPRVYNENEVKFTKFSLALARRIVKSNKCSSIYILTKNIGPEQDRLKQSLIERFFDRSDLNKIEYASSINGKKSELVNNLNIKWDSFADDYLDNTYDLLRNANGFGNEILIPKYGFNKPDEKASAIFYAYNAQVFYMEENLSNKF